MLMHRVWGTATGLLEALALQRCAGAVLLELYCFAMAHRDPVQTTLNHADMLASILDQLPYVTLARSALVHSGWRDRARALRAARRGVTALDVAAGQHVAVLRRLLAVARPAWRISLAPATYALRGAVPRDVVQLGAAENGHVNVWRAGTGPLLLDKAVTLCSAAAPAGSAERAVLEVPTEGSEGEFHALDVLAGGVQRKRYGPFVTPSVVRQQNLIWTL